MYRILIIKERPMDLGIIKGKFMQWTFGIITAGDQEERINKIIDSISSQGILSHNYEIIIVGKCLLKRDNLKIISFDENIKPGWITRKKNIIAQLSVFNNICLLHDYVEFISGWYKSFEIFGEDWDTCMNPIETINGERYRDWTLWPVENIPYEDHSKIRDMYISGTYFCVKKSFLLKHPFNENMIWGQGEDVEWSMRTRFFWNYRCNPNSIVRFLKLK
jgi:hypothetical protein